MSNIFKKISLGTIILNVGLAIFGFLCLYPFLMVISGSVSTSSDIVKYGFSIFPKNFTFGSYVVLFANRASIINGYKITIIVTVVGTFLSLFINSLMAFVLSRKNFRLKTFLTLFVLLPLLFNGGMVSWYIICIKYLHLKNTIFALIIPSLVSAWYIFLIRNYFNTVPEEIYESAKMDGAGDILIYRKLYLPLAKPALATVGLFIALGYWNDWWLGLMLVDKSNLQPLQLLLRTIVANIQFLQTMSSSGNPDLARLVMNLPADGIRMAMVIITIGPIILVYPFIQKYFVKGIMVGSVKG